MSGKVESVEIWRLFVDDQKHRMDIDIESLAQSIMATGQINPITVRKEGDEFRVIAGRRRYSALRHIQESITPDKKVKALVYVVDISELQEELIKIDENIMRQQLKGQEFDEAIFRRKEIYEELNPETKQHASGGHAKHAKATGKKKPVIAFTRDASKKLGIAKRTIELAIARASKASEKVKQARQKGQLTPRKMNLLVTLPMAEQDMLLSIAKNHEFDELKPLVDQAKKRGAKAVILDQEGVRIEDPRMRPLIKAARSLGEEIQNALENRLTLEGDSKHDSLRALDELAKRIEKFTSFQRSALGYVKAISKKGGERKVIRGRA